MEQSAEMGKVVALLSALLLAQARAWAHSQLAVQKANLYVFAAQ